MARSSTKTLQPNLKHMLKSELRTSKPDSSTQNFYSNLAAFTDFSNISDPENFVSVPDDWYIIITDIIASTQAIEKGKYKEVNLLGACCIVAMLNIAKGIEVPFVFGGDGASILIPPDLLDEAKPGLLAVQELARDEFQLEMRIGIVPVEVVLAARFDLKVAKFRFSENYFQAMFTGGGLSYATQIVKEKMFELSSIGIIPSADLSGLECRWQDIPAKHGEIVSLIVMETMTDRSNVNHIYEEVLKEIRMIYGSDEELHPIASHHLNLSFSDKKLALETKAKAGSKHWLQRWLYLLRIKVENLLGLLFMKFKVKFPDIHWGFYKRIVIAATDYKKFDDMLRMVISGDAIQRERLTEYLEDKYIEGKLVYGLHTSDRALMTCLVFERNGRHVHFVDGADGGYVVAAKAMKYRMHHKALNWRTYVNLIRLRKN